MEIALFQKGPYVKISITDTGCGIPPHLLERVFEPFFTTKPEGQGTGLRLSMVYGFVRQSKGMVSIDSAPRQSTTVTMAFPLSSQQASDNDDAHSPPVGTNALKETILLVEDDDDVRKSTVIMLKILGFTTHEARNGREAMAVLDRHDDIDIVITDMVMPSGVSGIDIASPVVRTTPPIAVILSSGYPEQTLPGDLADNPAVAFLPKPYTTSRLADMIRTVSVARRNS